MSSAIGSFGLSRPPALTEPAVASPASGVLLAQDLGQFAGTARRSISRAPMEGNDADAVMYRAKAGGKNAVEVSDAAPAGP